MNTSESLDKLAPALVNAQGNMPATTKDGKGYNYTYTTLDQIINKARPVLVANGLVIVQAPVSDNGQLGVTSRLLHESGQWLESTIMAAPDADKQKVAIQAAGSIITYLRRYAYAAILGLADETDTDGVPTPVKPAPGKFEQPPAPPRPEPNVGSTIGQVETSEPESEIATDARAASSPQEQAKRERPAPVTAPMPTAAMTKKFHAIGVEKYGDAWDDKRPELVKAISGKRVNSPAVTSSKELNRAEMQYLIDGMTK